MYRVSFSSGIKTPNRLTHFLNRATLVVFAASLLLGLLVALSPKTSHANDLPVITKSGTLSSSETWEEGYVYSLTGTVTVPNGIILTIEPGAIVKHSFLGKITVNSGGTLNAVGTSGNPIIFTSITDDSYGGNSNGGSGTPYAGEYVQAVQNNGGEVALQYAEIYYPTEALHMSCATGEESSVIDNYINGKISFYGGCDSTTTLVQRNTIHVTKSGEDAASVPSSSLTSFVLSGANANSFTGPTDRGRVVYLQSGDSLASGQSWTATSDNGAVIRLNNNLSVSGNLTIEPNTIVKHDYNGKITVNSGGTLTAVGSSSEPIVFTSSSDDSHGGDNNGTSGTPYAGEYIQAIQNSGGTLTLQHAEVYYPGEDAVNMYCNSGEVSTVSDNFLNGKVNLNGSNGCGSTIVQRNTIHVTKSGRDAMFVASGSLTSVVLAGSNANSFTGTSDRGRVIVTGGSGSIASGKSWTATSDGGAVIWLSSALSVSGTLTIEPGTIVKSSGYGRISVESGGTLTAVGTSVDPIIFTSYKDDSYGGDSNGSSGTPIEGDYYQAIQNGGGTLTLQHAEVYYPGEDAVNMYCNSGEVSTVSDNFLNGKVNLNGSNGCGSTIVQRNTIHVTKSGRDAMFVASGSLTSVVLAGSNANSFTGTSDRGRVIVTGGSGSLASGQNWTMTSDGGAIIRLNNNLSVSGDLTIEPGTVIKHEYNGKITVNSGGSLTAVGTSSDPIVFTSFTDDSYGGDSNGTSGTPYVGEYSMAVYAVGGSNVLTGYTVVKYAGTAYYIANDGTILDTVDISYVNYGLVASGDGHHVIRGKLSNVSNKGVQACDWPDLAHIIASTYQCTVDAAYVDWNSVDGPFPSGGDLVCGAVHVSPWLYNSTQHNSGMFGSVNCGTNPPPTPDAQLFNGMSAQSAQIALADIDCSTIQDACDAAASMRSCITTAYNLAASNAPFSMPTASVYDDVGTYSSNISTLFGVYVGSLTDPAVDLIDADFKMSMVDGLATIFEVADAYNTCQSSW